MAKPIPPLSARRLHDVTSEIGRYDGSTNRSNRYPTLTQTQISNNRLNTTDEKARRSQVFKNLLNIRFLLFY